MKTSDEVKKELKELSPFLSEMKKKPGGFKVPDRYFMKLPGEVIGKAKRNLDSNSEKTTVLSLLPSWLKNLDVTYLLQPRIAVGFATIIVLITAALLLFLDQENHRSHDELVELTVEDIRQYFSENIDQVDDELLIEISLGKNNASLFDGIELNDGEIDIFYEEIIKDLDEETIEEFL